MTVQTVVRLGALLALTGALFTSIQAMSQGGPAAVNSQPPAPVATNTDLDIKRESNKIQAQEVALKSAELAFRMREADLTRQMEWWKTVATFASVFVAVFAVGAPVLIGVRSVAAQQRIASEQAKVQFRMKAVDLVLQGSVNAKQAKERARALVALFKSDWLPERFAQDFDHADFRIDAGSSLGRRLELLKLLAAAQPGNRQQILKDWYVINHGDWWFVDPLLLDLPAGERKALEEAAARTQRNDQWSGKHLGKPAWIPGATPLEDQ